MQAATCFRTFLTQTLPHFPGHVVSRSSGHGCNEGEDVDSRVSVVAEQLLEQRGDGTGRRDEVRWLIIRRDDKSGVGTLGQGQGLPSERGGGRCPLA
jgi:hypothetical protein